MSKPPPAPIQSIPVYQAGDVTVVNGANLGDPMSFAAELDLDDTYELRRDATPHLLSLQTDGKDGFIVAEDSEIGVHGATLYLDSCLTLMSGNGVTTEVLILVEVDDEGDVEAVYALPLAPLTPRLGYALVGISKDDARTKFAEVACVSFTRGNPYHHGLGRPVPDRGIAGWRCGSDP